MKAQELLSARVSKGWTQTEAATRLGMTQAYLNFLERGKRRLTPKVVRRATSVYGLSPEVLFVDSNFVLQKTDDRRLTELLSKLDYPGFSYLRSNVQKKHPYEVLLVALGQTDLDGRVAEALPWVALKYARPDSWLVENARRYNLQNRLGFVVTLARKLANSRNEASESEKLFRLERMLDESRLVKEDVFYRTPRTDSERVWMKTNRTDDAAHWNLVTDLRAEHLQYGHK